jgi:ADP-ribose diphosphatase
MLMPKRIGERIIAKSKHFDIKEVDLEFSSGKRMTHEIVDNNMQGVTIVPIDKDGTVFFVREYLTGAGEYQLGLCKGGIEPGQNPEDTANRELQEEVGYKAGRLDKLAEVFLHPAYTTAKTHIFLARDLKESKLVGDEGEELEVVPYPFKDFEKLIDSKEIHDARIIAALYLAKRFVDKESETL